MGSETFKLSILLEAKDNVSPSLKKLLTSIKSLDRESKSAFKSLDKLFGLSGKGAKFSFNKQFAADVRKSNSEAAKLQKTLALIGKIKTPKISLPTSPESSPKSKPVRSGGEELDNVFDDRRKPKRKSQNYVERLANFNERVLEPIGQTKNVWKEQISSLREYTDETKNLLLAQAKFKLINLSPEENKRAFEAVAKVVRETGNVTRTEGIETLTDLHTAMGNLDHAIEALPNAAQYRFSMKTLFADKFSDSEVEEQIQNAYKFLEMTGKVAKGQEEMNRSFNALSQMTNATGGRVTPSEMLLLARRGGTSLQNLSPQGLRNLSLPIQELGGSGTGVALETMAAALVGGIMKQSSAERFDYFGLLDRSKIEYGKGQKIKKVKPGANKLSDSFMEDPLKATDMLRDAMAAKGVTSQKDIDKELYILFQNRNARKMAGLLINQRGQVTKEADLAKNSQDGDQMYNGMDKQLKDLKKVENAWIELKTTAGVPVIQMFGKLAEAALPILNFFAQHDKLTQWALAAILVGKGIKLVSETASILSGTGGSLLSFFRKSQSAATDATGAIGGFNRTANGLKGRNIPIGIQIGAIVGLEYAVQKTIETYLAAMEAKKGAKDSIARNTAAFSRTVNDPDVSADDKAKLNKMQAADVFGKLNTDNDLLQKFGLNKAEGWEKWTDSFKGMWWMPGMRGEGYGKRQSYGAEDVALPFITLPEKFMQSQFGKNYNVNTAAQKFRDDSPTLGRPDVMREFLKFLPERIKGDDSTSVNARNEITKIAQTAFPDAFKQASIDLASQTGGLSQSFLNLIQPTGSVIENFSQLSGKSSDAITGVGNLATATSGAAARLNAIEFKAPNFGTINIPMSIANPTAKPFSLFSNIPGRAKGGRVNSGSPYIVGEVGQELFVPDRNGTVLTNENLSKAANQTKRLRNLSDRFAQTEPDSFDAVSTAFQSRNSSAKVSIEIPINITLQGGGGSKDELAKMAAMLKNEVRAILKEEMNPDVLARKVANATGRYSELV